MILNKDCCSTILGPAVAPITGGYIDQYLGWRWIFYIKTIMGGVLTVLSYLFIKETLYIPNAKQLPPPTNMKERLQRLKFNPVSFKSIQTHRIFRVHLLTIQIVW